MIRSTLALLLLAAAPLAASHTLTTEVASTHSSAPLAQDETPLQKAMGTFKAGQRSVKKLMADPKANEAALLDTLRGMEAAALVSIAETPPTPEGLEGKRLEAFIVGYKRELTNLLGAVLDLQSATLAGDAAALTTGYEALSAAKKTGHQEYRDF